MSNKNMCLLEFGWSTAVGFQGKYRYDNAVDVSWFNVVLTCSTAAFPGLSQHRPFQWTFSSPRRSLMAQVLAWLMAGLRVWLRGLLQLVAITTNSGMVYRENLCRFTPATWAVYTGRHKSFVRPNVRHLKRFLWTTLGSVLQKPQGIPKLTHFSSNVDE